MDFLATMPLLNLILLLATIVIIIVLLTKAMKGKKIKIGNTEISEKEKTVVSVTRLSEREIIKRQVHIARAVCSNFKTNVPNFNKYSESEIENICYKVADSIEDLIFFNHLSEDKSYIDSRFEVVWSVVIASVNSNFTKEDEEQLKINVYEGFKKLIGLLVAVRKERE